MKQDNVLRGTWGDPGPTPASEHGKGQAKGAGLPLFVVLNRLYLCPEIINLLLAILKGLTLRLTLSCKSPFHNQNKKATVMNANKT